MFRQLGLVIVSFLVLLGLQFAQAQSNESFDLSGRLGVGVGAGAHSALGGEFLKNAGDEGFAGGAWIRYSLTSDLSLELSFNQFDYGDIVGIPLDESLRNRALMLSGGYRVRATNKSKFLFQLGFGSLESSNIPLGIGSRSVYGVQSFGLKLQIAYEYMLNQNWALGAMIDYYYADVDESLTEDDIRRPGEDFQLVSPIVGLTYYFGGSSAPVSMDSDGDGIVDSADKCSGTVTGAEVGADGCAIVPTAAVVDGDADGIADGMDKCPATIAGSEVNAFGCAMTEKVEFKMDVKFASGKSEVSEQSKGSMAAFAAFMQKYPEAKAEIEGHTDSSGKESFNVMISQKRADSVRNYLISNYKISADRLTAKGYGPSQPISDNKTAAGRAENRRVVANVQNGK